MCPDYITDVWVNDVKFQNGTQDTIIQVKIALDSNQAHLFSYNLRTFKELNSCQVPRNSELLFDRRHDAYVLTDTNLVHLGTSHQLHEYHVSKPS